MYFFASHDLSVEVIILSGNVVGDTLPKCKFTLFLVLAFEEIPLLTFICEALNCRGL